MYVHGESLSIASSNEDQAEIEDKIIPTYLSKVAIWMNSQYDLWVCLLLSTPAMLTVDFCQ